MKTVYLRRTYPFDMHGELCGEDVIKKLKRNLKLKVIIINVDHKKQIQHETDKIAKSLSFI